MIIFSNGFSISIRNINLIAVHPERRCAVTNTVNTWQWSMIFFHCKTRFNFLMKVKMKTKNIRISFPAFTFFFLQFFSCVPTSAWSFCPVQRFQSVRKRGCIDRAALAHLGTDLAAPSAMMKRAHVCCRPFFTACASNCRFVLFIETALVCFFLLFAFAATPHDRTQAFCWGLSGGSRMEDFCVLCHLMTTGSNWNEACQATTTKRNQ